MVNSSCIKAVWVINWAMWMHHNPRVPFGIIIMMPWANRYSCFYPRDIFPAWIQSNKNIETIAFFVSELSLLTDFKLANIRWDRYMLRVYIFASSGLISAITANSSFQLTQLYLSCLSSHWTQFFIVYLFLPVDFISKVHPKSMTVIA